MKNISRVFVIAGLLALPALVLAATADVQGGIQYSFRNPLGDSGPQDLVSFLNKILDFIILIATPIIVLMLIYVGFKFVAAQGNSDKLSEVRLTLLWTLVGAGIILGAKAILMAIQGTVTQIKGATGLIELVRHLV